jgi:hypothetical protein
LERLNHNYTSRGKRSLIPLVSSEHDDDGQKQQLDRTEEKMAYLTRMLETVKGLGSSGWKLA